MPSNLLASPREYQRIAGEPCAEIMKDLPTTEYALFSGFSDEQGQVAYRMRPDQIEIPSQDGETPDDLFLLVIKLSPQQMVAFGALSP